MIDCGEGTQITMRQMGIKIARFYSLLISHLHGDHCFGVMGLLGTLGMLKRTQPMHIYAHPDLRKLLQPWLDYHYKDLTYEIIFHAINPRKHETIYTDRTLTIETIPLKHRVPTCGFLFTEHHRDQEPIKRYAYCSDTMYSEKIIPLIEGVQTLYHEATYTEQDADKCTKYRHSTAKQAATIAQKAHVKQLILGHFSSRILEQSEILNEAKPIFENTIIAKERTKYTI